MQKSANNIIETITKDTITLPNSLDMSLNKYCLIKMIYLPAKVFSFCCFPLV